MKKTLSRNAVIIDGIRHEFIEHENGVNTCRRCSLNGKCDEMPFCKEIFGRWGMFQLNNNEK